MPRAYQYEAKVLVVAVAFVGASSQNPFSANLAHGPRYESRLRPDFGGKPVDPILTREIRTIPVVSTSPLQAPSFSWDPTEIKRPDPTNPLFGRGVAGPWEVWIEEGEITLKQVDLTHLTEMQIWIGYMYFTKDEP